MHRIREGFAGQKLLVLPEEVVRRMPDSLLAGNLYITNIGFFPQAHFHYVKRNAGLKEFILIYCVSGEGWYRLANRCNIKAGHYFILPANQPHTYGASQDNPWTIYWLHFSGRMAESLWKLYHFSHFPSSSVPFSGHRLGLFNKLFETLEKGYSKEHIQFTSLSLGYLMSSFLHPNIFEHTTDQKSPDMTDRAIEYMRQNLCVSMSLNQVAERISYSIPHLASEFKKKTGYSVIDYHNRLRIQKACQYLDLTDMPIKEVASTLGFQDPYYFSRLFSKIIGKSPRAYKNQSR